MSTPEEKLAVFRGNLTRMTERDLVTRIKLGSIMMAVDAEFARRSLPEMVEESNARLYQMGGVRSPQEFDSIVREELERRNAAKASVV